MKYKCMTLHGHLNMITGRSHHSPPAWLFPTQRDSEQGDNNGDPNSPQPTAERHKNKQQVEMSEREGHELEGAAARTESRKRKREDETDTEGKPKVYYRDNGYLRCCVALLLCMGKQLRPQTLLLVF